MGDRFLRDFNNPGQLIVIAPWRVGGLWRWREHFKAFTLPRGELLANDLISDSNRPAQFQWQENTQALICWTYVWFAFCPRRWITLIPAAWEAGLVGGCAGGRLRPSPGPPQGQPLWWGPAHSLMLLGGYEVRGRGGIAFSSVAERLRGLQMIM